MSTTSNEKAIVRHMLAVLHLAGWLPVKVDDGGDEYVKATTPDEVIEAAFAVEEANIHFSNGKRNYWVCLVFGNGNEGRDVICDHTIDRKGVSDGFEDTMNEVCEWAENYEPDTEPLCEDIATLEQESRQMRARMERIESDQAELILLADTLATLLQRDARFFDLSADTRHAINNLCHHLNTKGN